MRIRPALFLLTLSTFIACDPGDTGGAGGSSSSGSSTGPIACASYGDAKAGEACASDCDCCGGACSVLTADGAEKHVCAAPCIQQADAATP